MPVASDTKYGFEAALADLQNRTLTALPNMLSRLVYLASTRDYSTGRYFHEGMAWRFGQETTEAVLAAAHRATLRTLVMSSLSDLAAQIEAYLRATEEPLESVLDVWQKLHPYRVIIPINTDPLSAEMLFSNIRIALEFVRSHWAAEADSRSGQPQP
jgi:hypothetical protein